MNIATTQRSAEELEQGLGEIMASPQERGRLEAIYVRPAANERRALLTATLSPTEGIEGDRWRTNHWKHLPDGRSDPGSQLTVMNARVLRHIAGGEESMSLAGDNLIVDLDLSAANLPAGSRLRIGDTVVLEITAEKHTGCRKFSKRYGAPAKAFVNSSQGKNLNLRGRYAKVIEGGTIQVGAIVEKL
jgi:hypothetical protein